MVQQQGNNFSLFRPTSDFTRRVRNIILSMLVIWAVAVFGFQILLKVIEKPTPEKSNITFAETWPAMMAGQASLEQQQQLAISLVTVAGKTTMTDAHQAVLDSALTLVVFGIAGDSLAALVNEQVAIQTEAMSKLGAANDQEYLAIQETVNLTRTELANILCPLLNIPNNGLEATLLPFHLLPNVNALTPQMETEVKKVVDLYTIHNQSVLTDTKFLGFPFHYFYTAEFLLILFVVLCYLYNVRLERLQKKFGIVE